MKSITKRMFGSLGKGAFLAVVVLGSLLSFTTTAVAETCAIPLDVVVVFDRSDSMSGQPLNDAQDATIEFIDTLDSSLDKLGLVNFYEQADLDSSLTSDFNFVKGMVLPDWTENWTNTGAGIEAAREELAENGRDDVKHVIVLLSDGNPTRPTTDDEENKTYAFEKANDAKDDGIVIYTIGLGDDVNPDVLKTIASDPSNYYYAPTSGDIAEAYRSLSESMCEPEVPQTFTLIAHKVVCDDESYLPNAGAGSTWSHIDENTVFNFLEEVNADEEHCSVVEWTFQWAPQGTLNPGDEMGEVSEWESFATSTVINLDDLPEGLDDYVWVRESMDDDYIGFSGVTTTEEYSAEMYCSTDVLNYDNYDRVDGPVAGETYYCAAFNTLKPTLPECSDTLDNDGDGLVDALDPTCSRDGEYDPLIDDEENQKPVITLATSTIVLTVGDSFNPFASHATAADFEDGDITAHLTATGTVNTAVVGTSTVTYNVEDSEGLDADPKVLMVIVLAQVHQCSDTLDNDGDGLIDALDSGCWTNPTDPETYDPNDDNEYYVDEPVNHAPVITLATTTVHVLKGSTFNPFAGYATTSDVDGDVVTLSASSSVNTSATGTYAVLYTAVDEHGAEAVPQTLTVIVDRLPQCSDAVDNDGDGTIDALDLTCSRNGVYDPNLDNEANQKPVITLTHGTLNLTVGDSFNPMIGHATAADFEDGDITASTTATSTVNTALVGSYTVVYGVSDSEGLAADPKTLTVTVAAKTVIHSGGGGGGGGSAWFVPQILSITNESVTYLGNGNAVVSWNTNLPSTSQVVYGDESIVVVGTNSTYGYDSINQKDSGLVTLHSMQIGGLVDGKQYWFRPLSGRSTTNELHGKEVTYTFVAVPGQCNYLLEYIKLGANNNPVEVEKLERFLNLFEGETLVVNGIYEQTDFDAVERFQMKYFADILAPWGHTDSTGYVYITTKKKINELYCTRAFPVTGVQQAEIDAFRAFLASLIGQNVEAAEIDTTDTVVDVGNIVGLGSSTDTLADTTVKGPGLLTRILDIFGFGKNEDAASSTGDVLVSNTTGIGTDVVAQPQRNLASVLLGGVVSVATSYWFIFLLAVFALILFLRIRGAEKG